MWFSARNPVRICIFLIFHFSRTLCSRPPWICIFSCLLCFREYRAVFYRNKKWNIHARLYSVHCTVCNMHCRASRHLNGSFFRGGFFVVKIPFGRKLYVYTELRDVVSCKRILQRIFQSSKNNSTASNNTDTIYRYRSHIIFFVQKIIRFKKHWYNNFLCSEYGLNAAASPLGSLFIIIIIMCTCTTMYDVRSQLASKYIIIILISNFEKKKQFLNKIHFAVSFIFHSFFITDYAATVWCTECIFQWKITLLCINT